MQNARVQNGELPFSSDVHTRYMDTKNTGEIQHEVFRSFFLEGSILNHFALFWTFWQFMFSVGFFERLVSEFFFGSALFYHGLLFGSQQQNLGLDPLADKAMQKVCQRLQRKSSL